MHPTLDEGVRCRGMPEVPTIDDAGVPGYDVRCWTKLMVQAHFPKQ